jgi:heme-degrading monooxygenase HmoA
MSSSARAGPHGMTTIARIWTGTVQRADADEYATYIRDTGFADYGRTPGNRGAWMLRRDDGEQTEFITLSMWESRDAIRAFAGEDIEAAVLYPEDERYLIDGRSSVTHYEVVDRVAPE